jgi:hypothetical protein
MTEAMAARIKKHWVFVTLYVLLSLFFLVAATESALTYSSVVNAQEQVALGRTTHSEDVLPNGTLLISFSMEVVNPSRFDINVDSVSWYVKVYNGTEPHRYGMQIAVDYIGSTEGREIASTSTDTLYFTAHVTDSNILSSLNEFINYSASKGIVYTLATVPFVHEFDMIGHLAEFEHNYLRERYLNDLVKIDLRYSSEGAGA